MSRSNVNYVNDNTVGKRQVVGAIGLGNKVYERIAEFGFKTASYGDLSGVSNGTEDTVGLGDGSQKTYYLSTVVNSTNVDLYIADDENGASISLLGTFPVSTPTSPVDAFNPNSGKMVLTDDSVDSARGKYIFASYSYIVPNGEFEVERRIIDESLYIEQYGGTAQMRHMVGDPQDTATLGNYRHDRLGLNADGTARRSGDIFIVKDRVTDQSYVAFGAITNLLDDDYWKEIIPIAEMFDDNEKYIKDVSLQVSDVIKLTVSSVVGQVVNVSETLVASELKAKVPYTMYLVSSAQNVALPIADNAIHSITIATGFNPTGISGTVYVKKKGLGNYSVKKSAL